MPAPSSNGVAPDSLVARLLAVGKHVDNPAYVDVPIERLQMNVRVMAPTPQEYKDMDSRARNNDTGVRNEMDFIEIICSESIVEAGPDEDPIGPKVFKGENLAKLGYSLSQGRDAIRAIFYTGEQDKIATAALRSIGYQTGSAFDLQVKTKRPLTPVTST